MPRSVRWRGLEASHGVRAPGVCAAALDLQRRACYPAARPHPLAPPSLPLTGFQATLDPESKKLWRQAGNTGAVGLEIAIALVIGYFGGQYLDGKFGSTPWLTWIGFGAGIGAGIKALVRVARQYARENPDPPAEPPDQSSP